MKKKTFRLAAVAMSAVFLGGGMYAVVGTASASQKKESVSIAKTPHGKAIIIATIVGTTGAYGSTGVVIDDATKVAIAYLNSTGGILGRPVEGLYYNDGASATVSSEEFKRALTAGAVVINGSSDTGPDTAAEADRYQIPDVGIVDDGGPTIYPNGPGTTPLPWVFEFSPDNYAIGNVFANYALKNCPGGLALLHDTTDYGAGASDEEVLVYKDAGKTLKVDDGITETWATGATVDMTSEIDKIKASGADCIDVWLTPADQSNFMHELNTLGYRSDFKILGNDESYATPTYTALAGKLATGTISAMMTATLPADLTASRKLFDSLYEHAYHKNVGNYSGAYQAATWDAIMMVAKAIEEKKSTKNTAIQTALNHMETYHGATGTLSFTKKQHETVVPKTLTLVHYDAASKSWVPVS